MCLLRIYYKINNMKELIYQPIKGYLEGYYGNLLEWKDRERILDTLSILKFNSYFYCPKEDINHRFKWRKVYNKKWQNNFKKFCKLATIKKIKILAGISPGLDYNFSNIDDYNFLKNKILSLIRLGANEIVILFDDIIERFSKEHNSKKHNIGFLHANLINKLSNELQLKIHVVPSIYADELIIDSKFYLNSFLKTINERAIIFYCGKKIIATSSSDYSLLRISQNINNDIIIWDNFYANDYCPRKIFITEHFNKNLNFNVLYNLTGSIEIDLILLKIIQKKIKINEIKNGFNKIAKYFKHCKNISNKPKKGSYLSEIKMLDEMLWNWKTPLARELYPYLMIIKQDLQLYYNELNKDKILKSFTYPHQFLLK